MKRWLTVLLALVMLVTTAMPVLALEDVMPPRDSDADMEMAMPVDNDAIISTSCNIDVLNEISQYIDLAMFEQWAYEVFRSCPTTTQYFSDTALGQQFQNKIPKRYAEDLREYLWYSAPLMYNGRSCGIAYTYDDLYVAGYRFSTYRFSAEVYQQQIEEIEANRHYFLDGLQGNNGLTDLQKVVLLHDRITNWTEYDYDGYEQKYTYNNPEGMDETSYTMYGTIVRRDSVCQGISQAMRYFGDILGLDIKYCRSSKLNHAWNIVILNGQRYYMDATWDDPVADLLGRTKHDYLLCSKYKFGHDSTDHASQIPTEADVDYERTCTDTRYDNAFWQSCKYSSIQLVNNQYVTNGVYYINSSTQKLMRWVNSNDVSGANDQVLYSTGDTYSNLASDGERLFFSSGRTVYEWNFATNSAEPLWTMPASASSSLRIKGMQFDNRAAGTGRRVAEGVYSGGKLWVKALTGTSISVSNATQFDNVFEVPIDAGPLETYSVTVTNGTATPTSAMPGETITIRANAAASGMLFDRWTVDADSTAVSLASSGSSQTTFSMPAGNVKVTATYRTKPTTMPETGYSYLVNGDFSVGDTTAANFGWKRAGGAAVSVTNGVASVTNGSSSASYLYQPIMFTPGHSYTLRATFTGIQGQYAGDTDLDLILQDGGTSVTKITSGQFEYTFTATAEMTRIAFPGYKRSYSISNVTLTDNTAGGGEPSNPPPTQSATQPIVTTYAVTVANGSADKNTAAAGEMVTVTAGTAPSGYTFDKWTSADVTFASATGLQTTFTMPAKAVTVTATFKKNSYTISVTNGSASKLTAGVGDSVTVSAAAAASGMTFDKWVVKSGSAAVSFANASATSTTFTMPAGNVSVEATYKALRYTVTVTGGSADKATAAAGELVTLTVGTVPSGKVFSGWSVNPASVTVSDNRFAMPAQNVTVSAVFEDQPQESSVPTPQGLNAVATATGIRVSWNAVSGAAGYRVYKKDNGQWKTVKTLNDGSATSFEVIGLNAGVAYTFTVQAFAMSGVETVWSGYNVSGVTATTTFGAPIAGTATASGLGIQIDWAKVSGASGYRVYRRTIVGQTVGSWKTIATIASNNTLTYTDFDAVAGTEYAYTVQAYTGSGANTKWSTYDPYGMRGRVTLAQPLLGNAQKGASGVTVSWSAVNGATGYRIYRFDGSAWKTVKTVLGATTVSYVDTNKKAVVGAKYTVQAFLAHGGVVAWSEPNTTGVTAAV